MTEIPARTVLLSVFTAGLEAAMPAPAVARTLKAVPPATHVLAVGKAALDMAWGAAPLLEAARRRLLVTRTGGPAPPLGYELVVGGHPRPDAGSLKAGLKALELARDAGAGDHLLVLLSGGASALMAAPSAGLTLEDKADLMDALMAAGADIEELNLVRRRLSQIKGGRLAAAAHPAKVTTLALSDVVGDRAWDIGSGPTVGDPTTCAEAAAVLARRGMGFDESLLQESVKPDDPRLAAASFTLVGGAGAALEAAAAAARSAGFAPVILGADLTGEAREVGALHGRRARDLAAGGSRAALISGGELTVSVRGRGRGGPNLEYAAAAALEIRGAEGIHLFAGDTDGLDGSSGACGAFGSPASASEAETAGLPLEAALDRSDTAEAFERIGALHRPGPTGTNVNDLRIILVGFES